MRPSRGKRSGPTLGALLVLAWATPAAADGPDALGTTIGAIALTGELLIPDVRFESSFATERRGWTLSWPIAPRVDSVAVGDSYRLRLLHFVEYQLRLEERAHRGVLGERLLLSPWPLDESGSAWAPLFEVGGLLGQDGSGVILGAGVAHGYFTDDVGAALLPAFVARVVLTDEEHRFDVSVDLLQLPWSSLSE